MKLFDRSPRRVTLTPAGRELLGRAHQTLAAVDGLVDRAGQLATGADQPDAIKQAFGEAGVTGWLHAVDIDDGSAVDISGDEVVAVASVFKVPLMVALHRAADAGRLRLDDRVKIGTDRTTGISGLSVMYDEAELSLRDLALLMISVSDNAAADAVLERVGFEAVRETLDELGLEHTAVVASFRDQHNLVIGDTAGQGLSAAEAVADPAVLAKFRLLDPTVTNRSTPREMTKLFAQIWRDEAASATACAEMRRVLRLQVCRHRLAAGFLADDIRVAGKTGTLLNLRHEAGVIEWPDGRRYAVTVFTRSDQVSRDGPAAEAVIGQAARRAVDQLRTDRPLS